MTKRPLFWTLFIGLLILPLLVIFSQLRNVQRLLEEQRGINLVLITLDTVRADGLGCYGNASVKTPHIDRLSKQSIFFSQALSPIPITNPSHCSMMTGLYPHHHKVFTNGIPLDSRFRTIPRMFCDLGYLTAAFVSGFSLVSRISGLDRYFGEYDDGWSAEQVERTAGQTTQAALRWWVSHGRKPHFLWVHYFDPHDPYAPPEPFNHFYLDIAQDESQNPSAEVIDRYRRITEQAREQGSFAVIQKDLRTTSASSREIEVNRSLYWGEISYCDREFGKLMSEFYRRDRRRNSTMIVTGDHGEGFDHDYYFAHGDRLYDSAIHVPLLFYYPQSVEESRLRAEPVGLIDLVPTLIGWFGLSPIQNLDGRDLEPQSKHRQSGIGDGYLLIVPGLPRPRLSQGMLRSYRSQWSKLIHRVETDQWEMYDLEADPGELTNRVGSRIRVESELRNHLDQMTIGMDTLEVPEVGHLDEETREGLRKLGYLE